MKRGRLGKPSLRPDGHSGDAQRIDAQYGLEPVIDVSASGEPSGNSDGVQAHVIDCPYCGEHFETSVDTSYGSTRYVEDCQICCQPIEFVLDVDHEGVLRSLLAVRGD